MDVVKTDRRIKTLRTWAWVSAVANAALIVTGGLVRLTKSGLGCPNWPTCEDTLIPDGLHRIHVAIEFGNRVLTFVLVALAIVTFLAARRTPNPLRRPAIIGSLAVAAGIIGQAVVGGITVLTKLNPWVVALHLVLSLFLVAACVWLATLTQAPVEPRPPRHRWLTWVLVGSGFAAMWLGTLVTGAGPNSGDHASARNGLDLYLASRVHAVGVWVLVAATIIALIVWRKHSLRVLAGWLLVIEIAQGIVGYWQYFNGLPLLAVALHMMGVAACTIVLARLACRALGVGLPEEFVVR